MNINYYEMVNVMKIVISSTGPDLDSAVDPRFGRAAYFLIVDSDTGELVESIDNAAGVNAGQGAGIGAAALVVDKDVQAIMTGHLGPKAMAVIDKTTIKVLTNVSGTVRAAVSQFKTMGTTGASEPVSAGPSQEVQNSTDRSQGQGCGLGQGKGQGKGGGKGGGWCGGGQGRGGKCRQGQV